MLMDNHTDTPPPIYCKPWQLAFLVLGASGMGSVGNKTGLVKWVL